MFYITHYHFISIILIVILFLCFRRNTRLTEINKFEEDHNEEIETNRCLISQNDINNYVANLQEEIDNYPQLWYPGEDDEYNVSYIYIYIYYMI